MSPLVSPLVLTVSSIIKAAGGTKIKIKITKMNKRMNEGLYLMHNFLEGNIMNRRENIKDTCIKGEFSLISV